MEKVMKKLLIPFVSITWILCSVALCTADDSCPSSLRWESGAASIKYFNDKDLSSCETTITQPSKSDPSEKGRYKYGSADYISKELIASEQEDQDY
jgi:hypothetical protein